jgi:hypothetical protein
MVMIGTVSFSQKDQHVAPSLTLDPNPQKTEILSVQDKLKKIEGTFQFIISKQDYSLMVNETLVQLIEVSRKESEDVILKIDEFTELYLPSKVKISSAGYTKLSPCQFTSK